MGWSNPFRRADEDNVRTAWGFKFHITPDHLTPEESEPLKHSYDVAAEECYLVLNEMFPVEKRGATVEVKEPQTPATPMPPADTKVEADGKKPAGPKRDLYALLRDNHDAHPALENLWQEAHTIPEWVDWEQIKRGQDVFYRYGDAILSGLAFQSLLGGMGVNRVVETLARTGGFSAKVARQRLYETTQHVLQCTRDIDSMQIGGDGWVSSVRVRLLHAAVRDRILKLERARPGYYDVAKFGVPINDLDCIGTIGAFCATIVWLSLPRQGIWMRQQEIEDYNALWRLVAHYMGTPTEFFATTARSKAMMETLLLTEVKPSQTSRVLAHNLISCLENTPPTYGSRSFLEVSARWLNGNELCDELGLGRPGWYYWALMAGQCVFFSSLSYAYRSVPMLDRRKQSMMRRLLWHLIVQSKWGLSKETKFEFKFLPGYNVDTYMGSTQQEKLTESKVERRNLQALLFATGVLAFTGYLFVKTIVAVLG